MQELDPSPVDETPSSSKESYFPPPSPPQRSSTLGLSGHNLAWWLLRLQRYSSYTLSAFLTLHITNTSLIPLFTRSLPASDTYLLLTRPYYQSPLLEPLLVGLPIATHVLSGLALRLQRRRKAVQRYGAETREERRKLAWPAVSGTSALGFAFVPLLAGHVFVNRLLPLWVEGGSSGVGLQYVAHGFAKHPIVAFGGYAVLVGVGSAHFVWGAAKWMGWAPSQGKRGEEGGGERAVRAKRRWYGINGVVALLAGLWMAGGLGVVGRGGKMGGWVGKGYDELYRRTPVVGAWM